MCGYLFQIKTTNEFLLSFESCITANDVPKLHRMLAQGVDVNGSLSSGQTALFTACTRGFVEMTYVLLTNKAVAIGNSCPLIAAVCNDHLLCVYLLLKQHSTALKTQTQKALMVAYKKKNYSMVKLLLEYGASFKQLYRLKKSSLKLCKFIESARKEHASLIGDLCRSIGQKLTKMDMLAAWRYAFVHGLQDTALHIMQFELDSDAQEIKTLALFYSAKYNWPGIILKLLLNKLDVNSVLLGHGTALYAASSEGNLEIVKLLFTFGANPNIGKDSSNESLPLYAATCAGHSHIVSHLIDKDAVVNHSDCGKVSANVTKSRVLRLAIDYGSINVIEFLLENEPNNEWIKESLSLLLHGAILSLNTDLVEYLFLVGADSRHITVRGETLLHVACSVSDGLCRGCWKRDESQIGIELHEKHLSCSKELLSIVKLLLHKELDCNSVSVDGKLPLYLACERGHTEVVQCLLLAGCKANCTLPNTYDHPILKACEMRSTEIIGLLLSAGAELGLVNRQHESVLHLVIGNLRHISHSCKAHGCLLMDYRPSYPVQAKDILATQQEANEFEVLNAVELLVKCGADCNAVCSNGETPLYRAIVKRQRGVVKLLLDNGSNPNITTTNKFPLFAALLLRDKLIVSMLCNGKIKVSMNIVSYTNASLAWLSRKHKTVKPNTDLYFASKSFMYLLSLFDVGNKIEMRKVSNPHHLLISICLCASKEQHCRELDLQYGLLVACENGDVRLVDTLLSGGADVNYQDLCGKTPLHFAIEWLASVGSSKSSGTAMLELLLSTHPLLDIETKDHATPLYVACATQQIDVVKRLLDAGADPKVGMNPLRVACSRANTVIVNMLLNHGALSSTKYSMPKGDDMVPLIFAVQCHDVNLLNTILKEQSDVDEVDKRGWSALRHAVELLLSVLINPIILADAQACFRILLEAKADAYLTDTDGYSPLCVACEACRADLLEQMLQYKRNSLEPADDLHCRIPNALYRVPMNVAADRGYAKIVDMLISYGENINETDHRGNTPLHLTLKYVSTIYHECWAENKVNDCDYEAVLALLLARGADVNILNNRGETPLIIAAGRELLQVCNDMLLKFKADPNVGLLDKWPLCSACEKNNVDLAAMLLSFGTDPDVTAYKTFEPVSDESLANVIENVEKCDDGLKTKYSLPLCIATKRGNMKLARLLLQYKASVDLFDLDGLTPLIRAIQSLYGFQDWKSCKCDDEAVIKVSECVRFLLESGANPNFESRSGHSPLYYAVCILINLKIHLMPSLLCHVYHAGKSAACLQAAISIVRLLIEYGASLEDSFRNLGDLENDNLSLIHYLTAGDNENHRFLSFLLKAGCGFRLLSLFCRTLSDTTGNFRISTDLCKVVILAGYSVTSDDVKQLAEYDTKNLATSTKVIPDLVQWMKVECDSPGSLMKYCRIAIRNELLSTYGHENIIPHVKRLQLVDEITSYLCFESTLSEINLAKISEVNTEDSFKIPEPLELRSFKLDAVFHKDDFDVCG